MILTHGANSLPKGGNDPDVIGGRKYRTVTIGNQTWLAENLDFKFDVNGSQIPIGRNGVSSSEPRGNYYDDDETAYGVNGNKYGLLYNWAAVKYLNDHRTDLIPGWHVATNDEWNTLIAAVGGASVAAMKLKSTTGWSSGAGTDEYGFSLFPAGEYTGKFVSANHFAYLWTATEYNNDNAYCRCFDTGQNMYSFGVYKYEQLSLRLVKDVT